MKRILLPVAALSLCLSASAASPTNAVPDRGALVCDSLSHGRFQFGGVIGERIEANLDQWLLRAPAANPGLLEMFRVRDRKPEPQLVPWAGEFAGKYLISAVQALRMTDSAALRAHVTNFVADLISTQADDGYLGPFPKARRLRGDWDLWGHYHVMQGLLLWHEQTGDAAALRSARRAADLICNTYLDQPRRVFDAGSHEMNMAVLHVLGTLHRLTGEPRYLRMAREIEKDWERAGDYFRAGTNLVEFFASPRPRWESLHDLQGLVELWRITGEPAYRDAFIHHWRSIARFDRHNTGGFSSGEQATGNAYAPGAIETCCTIAWMALSIDMLRLTGDSRAADELELSTFNGAIGAQHPSGRWWTYNTPMDGVREASAHSIVFQARAGTPELNCCSVNAPRALGMLSEWAVMARSNGLVVNHHGPMQATLSLADGTPVRLRAEGSYPLGRFVKWVIELDGPPKEFPIHFRLPAWSTATGIKINGAAAGAHAGGRYHEIARRWQSGDAVELGFDFALRAVPGDREALGKVSLYRGPLLLAWDQRHNAFDEADIPAVNVRRLGRATDPPHFPRRSDSLAPWLLIELPTEDGRVLRLCDYASAGAAGTRYRSWLPAQNPPPPPPITRAPLDGATVGAGKTVFRWTTKPGALLSEYRIVIAEDADLTAPVLAIEKLTRPRAELDLATDRKLSAGRWYHWGVFARGPNGETVSAQPTARFRFDPSRFAPPVEPEVEVGPDGLVVKAALRGQPVPEFGKLTRVTGFLRTPGPDGSADGAVRLDGAKQMLVYALPEELGDDYSVAVRVRITSFPEKRIGQIFSMWAAGMDDPLRLTLDGRKLFARIEAQQGYGTKGVPIDAGAWHHIAAVKSGATLTLYLDGKRVESAPAPQSLHTSARSCALGGNPNYSGNEFLASDFADFVFYARALRAKEIAGMAK